MCVKLKQSVPNLKIQFECVGVVPVPVFEFELLKREREVRLIIFLRTIDSYCFT